MDNTADVFARRCLGRRGGHHRTVKGRSTGCSSQMLPSATPKRVLAVARSHQVRWRIEDFHETWKSGRCNVEGDVAGRASASGLGAGSAVEGERPDRLRGREASRQDRLATCDASGSKRWSALRFATDTIRDARHANESPLFPVSACLTLFLANLASRERQLRERRSRSLTRSTVRCRGAWAARRSFASALAPRGE